MVHPERPVPRKQAVRLVQAAKAFADAHKERDAAIVEAMKAGASLKSVADLVGMSKSRVHQIAQAGGWTAEEFHREAAERKERDERFAREWGGERPKRQVTEPRKKT